MTTTETPLRVRFAKALGWTELRLGNFDDLWGCPPCLTGSNTRAEAPPIDSNTVREAWKTLTPEERIMFLKLLINRIKPEFGLITPEHMAELVLDTEPTTLAKLICEVRGF